MHVLFSYASMLGKKLCRSNGAVRFSVRGFGCALFYLQRRVLMKILIWLGCALVTSIVVALIAGGTGALGAIPTLILYAPMFYIAKNLCLKVDKRRDEKKHKVARELQCTVSKSMKHVVCPNCGERQSAERSVCVSCGGRLPKVKERQFNYIPADFQHITCSKCGEQQDAGRTICINCGERLKK